jgi:pimeloyl-ACP methyl ester carboxylesterase
MTANAQTITLPDGRTLGYAEYVVPDGFPIFGFFGAAARHLRPPDEATLARGARLIIPERPGFGLSDFQPNRALLDWPDDVVSLADALELDRFAVVGASQGGPFAAACAYKVPDRLTAVSLVSALGPFSAPGATKGMALPLRQLAFVAQHLPGLLAWTQNLSTPMARGDPVAMARRVVQFLPEHDKQVLRRHPEIQDMLVQDGPEIYRNGGQGITRDMILATGPWGFQPEDIRAQVYLWQGELDRNLPPAMGRYLAGAIPGCRATFVPDGGHYMIYDHWDAIVAQIV